MLSAGLVETGTSDLQGASKDHLICMASQLTSNTVFDNQLFKLNLFHVNIDTPASTLTWNMFSLSGCFNCILIVHYGFCGHNDHAISIAFIFTLYSKHKCLGPRVCVEMLKLTYW